MKLKWVTLSILTFSLGIAGPGLVKAHAAAANGRPAAMAAQDHDDWEQPPQEFRDVQRRGFHEGIEAARRDFEHHHHADADDHDAYRHPHVPREDRDAYRDAFRRGYDRAMAHLTGHDDHDRPGQM
ncbi:MAG TPA: hypothetical protein VMU48_11320 [Terracidiphilus sp.]|nr:hypothetical protein [Terracidiphilus sp.]